MSIKGKTINVALSPKTYKDLEPFETIIPYNIELRNGHLTDVGNWKKRKGFSSTATWDISNNKAINLLIPESTGYAVDSDGHVYKLSENDSSVQLYKGTFLTGSYRPIWCKHGNDIVIANGGNNIIKISNNDVIDLGGSPPVGIRFIDVLDGYLIGCGWTTNFIWNSNSVSPTSFIWSDLTNNDSWSAVNFLDVTGNKENIENFKVKNREAFFFKSNSIEVWFNSGSTTTFDRKLWINIGLGASYSLVEANNSFYFYGSDGNFYQLNGYNYQIISKSYKKEIDKLNHPEDIYGFHFEKEMLIKWYSPVDGKCFVYDYVKKIWSEDNIHDGSGWQRMPINSYMKLNNQEYFGDYEPTGKIYKLSEDEKKDGDNSIRVQRKFALMLSDNGSRGIVRKAVFRVKKTQESGVTDPVLIFKWRFDQGPWINAVHIDISNFSGFNNRDPYISLANLGVGREVEIDLVEVDAVDFFLTHLLLTVDQFGY